MERRVGVEASGEWGPERACPLGVDVAGCSEASVLQRGGRGRRRGVRLVGVVVCVSSNHRAGTTRSPSSFWRSSPMGDFFFFVPFERRQGFTLNRGEKGAAGGGGQPPPPTLPTPHLPPSTPPTTTIIIITPSPHLQRRRLCGSGV